MEKNLVKLNVIDRQGNKTIIDVEEGTTIREAIMNKLAPDNYGLCEGNCICGTCHIYVDVNDFKKLKPAEENETETLETSNIEITTNSRLSCQIELSKECDNITVTIPSIST